MTTGAFSTVIHKALKPPKVTLVYKAQTATPATM
jgi:hypothetical protein